MGTGAFDKLLALDPSFCDRAGECGQRGFCMLAGTLSGKVFQSELLSYEGPFGVGYGVCACTLPSDPGDSGLQKPEAWKK